MLHLSGRTHPKSIHIRKLKKKKNNTTVEGHVTPLLLYFLASKKRVRVGSKVPFKRERDFKTRKVSSGKGRFKKQFQSVKR